jgi:hypothetical protein
MDGCHQRGVPSLAFSPDGSQLLSIGLDDSNTHSLWSDMGGGWSRAQPTSTEKGDKSPVRRMHMRCIALCLHSYVFSVYCCLKLYVANIPPFWCALYSFWIAYCLFSMIFDS